MVLGVFWVGFRRKEARLGTGELPGGVPFDIAMRVDYLTATTLVT